MTNLKMSDFHKFNPNDPWAVEDDVFTEADENVTLTDNVGGFPPPLEEETPPVETPLNEAPGFENSNVEPIGAPLVNNVSMEVISSPSGDIVDDEFSSTTEDEGEPYVPEYQRRMIETQQSSNPLSTFGSDITGNTPNNQFNEEVVNKINELISSEYSALDEYLEATKITKDDTLMRLFSDIANEERFHAEQLTYAKSVITGEKYIPKDPDIKKEYDELVALGMDEESAMTTAVDKVGLYPNVTEEELNDAASDVTFAQEALTNAILKTDMLLASYGIDIKSDSIAQTFMESYTIMEGIGNLPTQTTQSVTSQFNIVDVIKKAINALIVAIKNFIQKLKIYINKLKVRSGKTFNWIKDHGIKGIFANGINLYFFNEKTSKVDTIEVLTYISILDRVTQMVADNCKIEGLNFKPLPKFDDGEIMPPRVPTVDAGVTAIKGAVMQKSKVIVNEQNEEALSILFFGVSSRKLVFEEVDKVFSLNIFNIYQVLSGAVEQHMGVAKAVLDKLGELEQNPSSVYYTNKKDIYDGCVRAMDAVVKGYSKLSKCISADMAEAMKLNTSLIELTNQSDQKSNADNKVHTAVNPQTGRQYNTVEGIRAQGFNNNGVKRPPHRMK